MSDEKIARLERRVDDHGEKISHLETGHARNDERHKRHDARLDDVHDALDKGEDKWSWVIKAIATILIGWIVTGFLKGTVF